jgi:hypothetical protein
MNSDPLCYVFFVGHGYRESHAISTLFATRSAVLVSDWTMSNHPVAVDQS